MRTVSERGCLTHIPLSHKTLCCSSSVPCACCTISDSGAPVPQLCERNAPRFIKLGLRLPSLRTMIRSFELCSMRPLLDAQELQEAKQGWCSASRMPRLSAVMHANCQSEGSRLCKIPSDCISLLLATRSKRVGLLRRPSTGMR